MATPMINAAVAHYAELSGDIDIDGLLVSTRWGSGAGTSLSMDYSFGSSSSAWDPSYSPLNEPLTAFMLDETVKQNARIALFAWESVSNIYFNEINETSQIVGDLRITGFIPSEEYRSTNAYAYTPASVARSADIWVNMGANFQFGSSPGTKSYFTLMHEIGHALGLKHPNETNSRNQNILPISLDNYNHTIMSYNIFEQILGSRHSLSFYPTTPMSADIKAIQYLYGKNIDYNRGNNIYTYDQQRKYFETIYDTGGIDTIVWNAASQGASIDLTPGAWSTLGDPIVVRDVSSAVVKSEPRTVSIYRESTIENATGGAGSDTLTGNTVNNELIGGGGNDSLSGASGHDNLFGGAGADTLSGGDGNDHLYGQSSSGGSDSADSLSGGAGIDYLQGNAGHDTIDGGEAADRIQGGQGDDSIIGGTGNDTLNGNLGNDNLAGESDSDSIRGGQGNDSISGGDGNDILSGDLGTDTLSGGAGSDIFQFSGQGTTSTAPDQITDFQDGSDRISLGFGPLIVLTGSVQPSLSSAASAAQSLLDGNAGTREVAAIAVGSDTYLFYASDGGASANSAIRMVGVSAGLFSAADFI